MKTITMMANFEFQRLWHTQQFPDQRFGQAFCNHFNITDPELFYCRDYMKTLEIIRDRQYVGSSWT